jgi:hypothetical protein
MNYRLSHNKERDATHLSNLPLLPTQEKKGEMPQILPVITIQKNAAFEDLPASSMSSSSPRGHTCPVNNLVLSTIAHYHSTHRNMERLPGKEKDLSLPPQAE